MSGQYPLPTLEPDQLGYVVGTADYQVLIVISPALKPPADYLKHFEVYWAKVYQFAGGEDPASSFRSIF